MRGWDVGIGAVSTLAVKVARDLREKGVPTVIIASRNQCPGYAFMTRSELMEAAGPVPVIRDHGGPLQAQVPDIGLEALWSDVNAGFSALHVDVCKLPLNEQGTTLRMLVREIKNDMPWVNVEVGDERGTCDDNLELVAYASEMKISAAVAPAGTQCLALRQVGTADPAIVRAFREMLPRSCGCVLHNADWCTSGTLDSLIEAGCTRVNIAPEVALAEVDAIRQELTYEERADLQAIAFNSRRWVRWFPDKYAGASVLQKARAATHYALQDPQVQRITKDAYRSGRAEAAVREAILRVS